MSSFSINGGMTILYHLMFLIWFILKSLGIGIVADWSWWLIFSPILFYKGVILLKKSLEYALDKMEKKELEQNSQD